MVFRYAPRQSNSAVIEESGFGALKPTTDHVKAEGSLTMGVAASAHDRRLCTAANKKTWHKQV
jgi:hypothetical protein